MTKKHGIAFANAIKDRGVPGQWIVVHLDTLADFCQQHNPNFKRELWLAYVLNECGQNGGKL